MRVLNEVIGNSRFCEALLVPGFDEKAALILEVIDVDDEQAFEAGSCDVSLHSDVHHNTQQWESIWGLGRTSAIAKRNFGSR